MSNDSYVIGITGHRHLPPRCIPTLTTEIEAFYKEKIAQHRAENITVLSSVAEGADTLCAKLSLDAGVRLVIPLPMNALQYRNDFSESALTEFDCLLSLADEFFVVLSEETVPSNPKQGYYYRQAGIYIAKNSDVLLAVWDGVERNTPDGAGTWETIKLAREFGKQIFYLKI